MAERYKQRTYGQEIDAISREIDRLSEVVKRVPQRSHELDQGHAMLSHIRKQMKALGKRRSSCFYGLEGFSA